MADFSSLNGYGVKDAIARESIVLINNDIAGINKKVTFTTPEFFGAVGDGVTDDSTAIQNAIDESSIIIFQPDKVYVISTPINIHSNKLIGLNGSTIKLVSEHPINMFRIIDSENVTIENGKFESIWEVGYESKEIPIVVSSSRDITFNNIEVTNCICDGMYIGYEYWYSGTDAFVTSNIKVKDCYIHDVGRNGISLVSGDNVIIENTRFSNISNNLPKACIDIEPETNNVNPHNLHISNVVIKGCVFEQTNGHHGVIISCPVDTLTFTAGEVVIEDCTFDGANIRYIHTKDSATSVNAIQTVFRNLYFKRPYLYGICVYNHPLSSKMVIENITSEKMVNTNDQPTYYGLITMLVGTDSYELGNVTIKDINLIGKGNHWNSILTIVKEYSETVEFVNKYKNCYFDFTIKNLSGDKIGSFNRLDLDSSQMNIVNSAEANSGTNTPFRCHSHIIYRSVPVGATLTMDSDWFREREIEVYDFNGRTIQLSKPEGYVFAGNNSANYCSFTAPSDTMHTIKIRLYNGKVYIDTDSAVTKTFS